MGLPSGSFIYIIGSEEEPVKIGYAEDVNKRLCDLQIGNPEDLVVHAAVQVPFEIAKRIEGAVHNRLHDKRRRGEWFNICADEAKAIVIDVVRAEKEAHYAELDAYDLEGDIFDRIQARAPLEKIGREAVAFYQTVLKVKADRKAAAKMNQYILDKVGLVPLEAFKRVFVNGQRPEFVCQGNPDALHNAYKSLAKAINALSGYYHYRKTLYVSRLAS